MTEICDCTLVSWVGFAGLSIPCHSFVHSFKLMSENGPFASGSIGDEQYIGVLMRSSYRTHVHVHVHVHVISHNMCMYMYWLLPGLLRNYWADRSADIYWSLEVLCAAHVVVRFHDDLTYIDIAMPDTV